MCGIELRFHNILRHYFLTYRVRTVHILHCTVRTLHRFSNFFVFQAKELNGHFVTMTNVSLPDGTIIMHSSSSPSVSPSHGDQRIIGKMLWRDERAIKRGDPPPTGMYLVLRGTDKYFPVIYVDRGYTFQPRKMEADKKISE